MCFRSMSSWVKAVIARGTVWTRSSRRRAVTTISSKPELAEGWSDPCAMAVGTGSNIHDDTIAEAASSEDRIISPSQAWLLARLHRTCPTLDEGTVAQGGRADLSLFSNRRILSFKCDKFV